MSFAQITSDAAETFGDVEYFGSISPLNKSAQYVVNTDTGRVSVVRGAPAVGQVLTYTDANSGTWNDPDELTYTTVSTSSGTIVAGTPGAQTGASQLTITTPSPGVTALALANTAVTPGTYGDGSNVAQITIDQQGRATAVSSVPIIAPIPTTINSIPTRTVRAGTGSGASGTNSTYIGDAAGTVPFLSAGVNNTYVGCDTGSTGVGVSNATGVGFSIQAGTGATVVGSLLSSGNQCAVLGTNIFGLLSANGVLIGKNLTSINNNENSLLLGGQMRTSANFTLFIGSEIAPVTNVTGIRNIGMGTSHYAALTSGIDNITLGSFCANLLTTGSGNIFIGRDIATTLTTGGNNIVMGTNCAITNAAGNFNVILGDQASGATSSVAIGASATAAQLAAAIGPNTGALAVRSFAFGEGITNSVANTMVCGTSASPTNFILRSTGVLKSFQSVGAAAGRAPPDPAQNIVVYPLALSIFSTRYSYPPGLVVLNRIDLGTYPDDVDSTFSVCAFVNATSSAIPAVFQFNLVWSSPPLANLTIATQIVDVVNASAVGACLYANIRIPNTTTALNSVFVQVNKLTAPAATLSVTDYRLQVNRFA